MPRRPSGSIMISAKLLVLGGAFDQASGGEMLLPAPPPRQLSPAYFAGSMALSLSVGEASVKSFGVGAWVSAVALTLVAAIAGAASSKSAAKRAIGRRGRFIFLPCKTKR